MRGSFAASRLGESRGRSDSLRFVSRNTFVQTLRLVNIKEATSRMKKGHISLHILFFGGLNHRCCCRRDFYILLSQKFVERLEMRTR